MPKQTVVGRALGVARLDFAPAHYQQPSAERVVTATAAA